MVPILVGIAVAVVVAVLLFRPIFGDREEFVRCVGFWLTPNWLSWMRGEYDEDIISELKLGAWIIAAAVPGALAWLIIAKLIQ